MSEIKLVKRKPIYGIVRYSLFCSLSSLFKVKTELQINRAETCLRVYQIQKWHRRASGDIWRSMSTNLIFIFWFLVTAKALKIFDISFAIYQNNATFLGRIIRVESRQTQAFRQVQNELFRQQIMARSRLFPWNSYTPVAPPSITFAAVPRQSTSVRGKHSTRSRGAKTKSTIAKSKFNTSKENKINKINVSKQTSGESLAQPITETEISSETTPSLVPFGSAFFPPFLSQIIPQAKNGPVQYYQPLVVSESVIYSCVFLAPTKIFS